MDEKVWEYATKTDEMADKNDNYSAYKSTIFSMVSFQVLISLLQQLELMGMHAHKCF